MADSTHLAELLGSGSSPPGLETRLMGEALRTQLFELAPMPVCVGRFQIERLLGQGAMGRVFLARDPQLDRRVAVKVVRSSVAGDDARIAMLLREARALARVVHPNVVTVYDSGIHEGEIFLALEYFDGGTLGQWIVEHPVRRRADLRAVLDHFVLAGRGLAAAHAAGLVHRDFKPANVLLATDGRVAVADFGLASVLQAHEAAAVESGEAEASHTFAGGGTPAYMAPEQFHGIAEPRADQFAFCVSLFEALVGERPPSTPAPVRMPASARLVPRWVRRAVERGLSRDPGARFPDIDALLLALDRHRRAARRRTIAVGGLLLVTAGALWQRREPSPCEGLPGTDAIWSPDRAAGVRDAFVATGSSAAPAAITEVAAAFDSWSQGWATQRLDACRATRERGDQSEARLEARTDCLDRARVEAESILAALTAADARAVVHASEVLARLPTLSRCEDPESLGMLDVLDPSERDRYTTWLAEIARASAEVDAGWMLAAQDRLRPIVSEIDDERYPTLAGRANLVLGLALDDSAPRADRLARHQRATQLAMVQRDPGLVAQSMIALGEVIAGNDDASTLEAMRWLDTAEGALTRATDPGGLRDALALARVEVYARAARTEDAEAEARRALAGDLGERTRLELERKLAGTLATSGHGDAGLAIALDALARAEARFGVDSGLWANLAFDVGGFLWMLGRIDEADAALRRAVEVGERLYGPRSPFVLDARSSLAGVLAARGELVAAQVEIGRTLALALASAEPRSIAIAGGRQIKFAADLGLERSAGELAETLRPFAARAYGEDSIRLGYYDAGLASFMADSGRFDAALAAARSVAAAAQRRAGNSDHLVQVAGSTEARALAGLGRLDEALTTIDALLAELDRHRVYKSELLRVDHLRSRSGLLARLGRVDAMRESYADAARLCDDAYREPNPVALELLSEQA
ncbi:MAG: serine/threonine protein kinase, partial [Myxococcales bacterium]|nr:serine/threonine protein kinase [Myxococcales bacterium]